VIVQRNSTRLLLVAGCVAAVFALTAAGSRSAKEGIDAREGSRLRAHFDSVLHELRSADVSRLSSSQRTSRATLIARLEGYAAAGSFPHNHVVADQYVPVFRDEHGTMCAMAFLIASTGRTDIVDDVAREKNLAYIPQLAGDARLIAWLDSTGLTVDEAARIQPMYGPDGPCACRVDPPSQERQVASASAEYFVMSGVALGVNALLSVRNMAPVDVSMQRARRNAALGFVAGASQVVLGAFALDQRGGNLATGVANVAIGLTSITASAWRMNHLPSANIAARAVSLQPFVAPDRQAGLMLSARM
jgi:hypothetical protein